MSKGNFRRGFWRQWRDDIIVRDMQWIRAVNPKGHTLESWMRATGYDGNLTFKLLKNVEDRESIKLNAEKTRTL
jgi:hypothetical protein